ncbi:SDR family oxidoreductase [sulfur-oxidizing endosymbiont of Gigantopelta aegis]|uniref:SDR family oxidoreductase n=1 Tax=sulfur-oxidizing endosymbiont of Gigantopelta aegis TaxID=2794934 RepID=UPI0018DCDF2D|nr:SDR family oxidoreductase [sulfur-oxidizing endosymbiont of Gigantopelta aegis]
MNILIVGVSGFIGQHLYQALRQSGHHLIGSSRHKISGINWQQFSFQQSQAVWLQQLQNIDLVINTVGIYQQVSQNPANKDSFSQVHDLGPKRLFEACRECKIKVIQISAIGAEQESPVSEFLQSKRNADQYLLSHELPNIVLYPGIVLGEQGRTTQQLSLLASLYIIPLVFDRQEKIPLISIYQLTEFIEQKIGHWPEKSLTAILIAKPETMEELLNKLRHWMGLNKGHFFIIPRQLINTLFYYFPTLSIGAFNQSRTAMLADYSNKKLSTLKNSLPQSASESLLAHKATPCFSKRIQLKKLFYINSLVLGIIWIISGLSSIINIELSRELMLLMGIKGNWGDSIIIIAALADMVLGILLWLGLWNARLMQWSLYGQITVMLIYSIILTITIPMFWLHPFAPIVKNLAILVLAIYLLEEIKKTPNTVKEESYHV